MKNGKTVTLAIESSCDETAAAVLLDGREVLSNIISSQIDIHKLYGGVVPEIASRHHLTNVNTVVDQALDAAKVTMDEVDLIGVTYGPGLVGALLIGLATAKAYALAAAYYEENGNLNIPRSYVTAAGERLGQWVASQQWAYPKGKLTDEQVERLNHIGMYWGNRNDRQWNEGYQEAKRYFDAHGDLNVPAEYVSPGGYNLGNWVKRQRYTRQNPEKSGAVLTEERIAKLDEIGMRWGKADSRLRRLELAQESKRKSENLNVSANHKTGEEIGLCS